MVTCKSTSCYTNYKEAINYKQRMLLIRVIFLHLFKPSDDLNMTYSLDVFTNMEPINKFTLL